MRLGEPFGEIDDVISYTNGTSFGVLGPKFSATMLSPIVARWFLAPRALAASARLARAIENVPRGYQEGDILVTFWSWEIGFPR